MTQTPQPGFFSPSPFRIDRRSCLASALAMAATSLAPTFASAATAPTTQAVVQPVKRPWAAGKAVPPLSLNDTTGRRWDLAALRGKVVVLNFWASWCEPCVTELPTLSWLAETHAASGELVVLGINYQEHEAKVQRFLQALPVSYPVLLDRNGETTKAWTPRIFPSTVLIGRDGRPVLTVLGELDWAGPQAEALLKPLLAAAPQGSR